MTGTNITVLDNFFYNIEKNIFSTIVLKSQKGLWKRELPDWIFFFFLKKQRNNNLAQLSRKFGKIKEK